MSSWPITSGPCRWPLCPVPTPRPSLLHARAGRDREVDHQLRPGHARFRLWAGRRHHVAQVLAGREDLTDEQREMVRRTCTSGDGVQVVVGAAGTGKTRGMSAIHQAYKTSGYQLIGASLGGHAAKNLEDSSGIPCFTISSLLAILQQGVRPA